MQAGMAYLSAPNERLYLQLELITCTGVMNGDVARKCSQPCESNEGKSDICIQGDNCVFLVSFHYLFETK
jgi:hypothetical protein